MINCDGINEAFVAGVGFHGQSGFSGGYATKGIRENPNYMKQFNSGRSDISIPVRRQELSVTIFPENGSCMSVVAANPSAESKVDSRSHVFSHGFVTSQRFFRKEILPYLECDEFDAQVCRGPAEEFQAETGDEIRFKKIEKEEGDNNAQL